MKRIIAILLTILTVCAVLSPMASAKSIDKRGIVSDPSITVFHRFDNGDAYYFIDIHTGDTITLWMVDSNGNKINVPKGYRVEWVADPLRSSDSGKVRLTPSADGSTCTLKAIKGGRDVSIVATIYDKNNKEVNWYLGSVQSRYTVPEWIAFYATLGMYGINWKNLLRPDFTDLNMFLMDLVLDPAIVLLQPFELFYPWEMFHTYY